MRGQTRTAGPAGSGRSCARVRAAPDITRPGRARSSVIGGSFAVLLVLLAVCGPYAGALGTTAGSDINNAASVTYQVGATVITGNSNVVTVTVAEIVDLTVTVQSPQTPVDTGAVNQALLFTLTNTGNGNEVFSLAVNNAVAGDDFDPVASATSIYFDTDASGDLSAADTAYVPGGNDPALAPDASVAILIVNDIPAGLTDGLLGQSTLAATSLTGTGVAGTIVAGAGDGGVDAIIGNSEGDDDDTGEYVIATVDVVIVKSAVIVDPFGGSEPVPGASITYRIDVSASGSGIATAARVDDPIPANTTYSPSSITLNGAGLSDIADADPGEFDGTANSISVQLGDINAASGTQVVEFTVVID